MHSRFLWALALVLAGCGGLSEPDWLADARSLEKARRPLCTRLNGVLHQLDTGAAKLTTQPDYDRYLNTMRGAVEAAVADCRERKHTY